MRKVPPMRSAKIISPLDRLPSRASPFELGKIVEPVAPFRAGDTDSFQSWVEQANYETGNAPLTQEEIDRLRKAWGK